MRDSLYELLSSALTHDSFLLQFHPESVATHYGRQILQNFKKMTSDFGLRSLWLDERKVHSIGKLEKSQVQSVMKYFTHTSVTHHCS